MVAPRNVQTQRHSRSRMVSKPDTASPPFAHAALAFPPSPTTEAAPPAAAPAATPAAQAQPARVPHRAAYADLD